MSRFLNTILSEEQKKMAEMKNSLMRDEKTNERGKEQQGKKKPVRHVVKKDTTFGNAFQSKIIFLFNKPKIS